MQNTPETLTLDTGRQFAQALISADYALAHSYLSQQAQAAYTPADLAQHYTNMIDYGSGPAQLDGHVQYEDMADWATRQNGDIGWVYISISGEDFLEAVTVIVSDEQGSPKIRQIDWGRP
ncbi:MAG: hypothetical protein AB7I41_05560 [Candidatus Sericytochromatia bacterium]